MTIHLNVAAKYAKTRPAWAHDSIPACDGPGDRSTDYYTLIPENVTCPGCKYEILAPKIDAGEVCPHCRRGGRITKERACGIPLFVCGCGAQWFDSVTMACEDTA